MLRRNERILTNNAEFIKLNIMKKHINSAQVICCKIYFLSEKSLSYIFFSKYLSKF
jgi:hypothetical protein